jgi:hypothetical protein
MVQISLMNLTINYNWPMGQDMAHATLGQPNIEDEVFEYRLGILPNSHPGMVSWKEPGWVLAAEVNRDMSVFVKREDKVVVERRRKGTEEIERVRVWNINEEWPAEAVGPSLTTVPWHF